jgi:WS/DGAT/MGAT family acyltransferase
VARQRLTPLDAAWLHMDAPNNPMVITGLLWFAEPMARDVLRELLEARLLARYPRFRKRVVEVPGRGPCWEDDPLFHVDNHLRHVGLPAPGDREALQALVSDQMSTPLDPSHSPWQFLLVDGYRGGSALICRIHHCVADGISLARVLLSLTDGAAPAPEPHPHGHRWLHALRHPVQAVRDGLDQARELGPRLLQQPKRLAEALGLGAEAALELERLLLLPADPPSALRQPLTVRKTAAWSEPMPLSAVKDLGHATGTTVNDVLVAVLSEALHAHLAAVGTPVDQVRAFVPVNLRPLDEPVDPELGNQFSLVVLPLPVGPSSPAERLAAVHAEMQKLKDGTQAGVVWGLLTFMGASPTPVEHVIVDIMARKGSLIVTNVPGPGQTLHMGGNPVAGLLVWVPQSGAVGLGVSILSYDGGVTVGVTGEASVLPEPDRFVARFAEAFEALTSDLEAP